MCQRVGIQISCVSRLTEEDILLCAKYFVYGNIGCKFIYYQQNFRRHLKELYRHQNSSVGLTLIKKKTKKKCENFLKRNLWFNKSVPPSELLHTQS